MDQFEPFYEIGEAVDDQFELLNPINIDELFSDAGSSLTLDINGKIAENDAKLLEMNDDETDNMTPSPWTNKFNDLKKLMQRIPVARYQGKREMICIFKRITDESAVTNGGQRMGRRKCKIEFSYQMYFEMETIPFDTSYHRATNYRTIRWDEMFLGIYLSLATMRKGECAEFIIDYRLMHGTNGIQLDRMVEPKKEADILFVVKMVDFVEVGDANLNDDTMKNIREFGIIKTRIIGMKNHALELFKQNCFREATSYNHRAIECLTFCETQSDADIEGQKQLLIECYMQLVDCYSAVEKWTMVILMVDKLTRFGEMAANVEILVKKAIALSEIGENYDESIKVLRKAQQIAPDNGLVAITLSKICNKRNKYTNEMKNMWQRAFKSKGNADNNIDNPLAKSERTKFEMDFLKMLDTFDGLTLEQGVPLAGYTADQFKLIDRVLANKPNIKLQRRQNINGNVEYTVRKSA